MPHIPVLLHECLELLTPQSGERFADGTLGAGGHAKAILERIAPKGTLLAVDRDARAVKQAAKTLTPSGDTRLLIEAASYAEIPKLMERFGIHHLDGLLLDLGFSSEQIIGGTLTGRGFSFMTDEPLLMTYSDETRPLAEVLAELSVADLSAIIERFGEERYALSIARSIAQMARHEGIATTGQLVKAITSAVPAGYEGGRIHPATRTFQALRIYVNQEFAELEKILTALPKIMAPGGRVAIITFHSLEDRIVKQFFTSYTREAGKNNKYADRSRGGRSVGVAHAHGHAPVAKGDQAGELPNTSSAPRQQRAELLTKKPTVPGDAELAVNPRARSAKVRALRFL